MSGHVVQGNQYESTDYTIAGYFAYMNFKFYLMNLAIIVFVMKVQYKLMISCRKCLRQCIHHEHIYSNVYCIIITVKSHFTR